MDEYPFSIDLYRTVYRQLGTVMATFGGCLHVVRGQKSFLGGNTFSHAWRFDGTWFEHIDSPVTLDLIWNKGDFVSDAKTNVINDPELDAIATDKWKSYEFFPTEHALTFRVHKLEEWEHALTEFQKIHAPMLVAKPIAGWGGTGVVIAPTEELRLHAPQLPCIVQQFVDTSAGIPGIVEGMHDLRVLMLASEIGLSYIRTPPPGEMTANVSRGGREIEVLKGKIPKAALALVKRVDKILSRFPRRIYTIDMGLGADGQWKLFELNTKPGFSPMETGTSYAAFYKKLAAFLVKASGTSISNT